MTTPNRGIPYVPQGTLDPAAGLNLSLNVIDALLQLRVISMALTAPPSTNGDGDLYVVAAPATGAWAGREDDLARFVGAGDFWQFYQAGSQVNFLFNGEDARFYVYDNFNSPAGWRLLQDLGPLSTGVDIGIFFAGGPPTSSQLLGKYVAPVGLEFPGNFAGAVGDIGTNPTASFVIDVQVAGSSIGSITISTGGAFTFASTGGLPVFADAGEAIEFFAPASVDASAADIAFTLIAGYG